MKVLASAGKEKMHRAEEAAHEIGVALSHSGTQLQMLELRFHAANVMVFLA